MATAAAMATKILSFNGSANAATAAAPATPTDKVRKRVVAKEHKIPTNARVPAKLKPHCGGIEWANAIPIKLEPTQLNQFKAQLPAR